MEPGKSDLDRGTRLTMLRIKLALREAQPVASVAGFDQPLLGVVDGGLQLDQGWRGG
jgi:hypothetical protein